ncbi:hypothetical protein PIROE2DRAFT_10918, partial [Piromyces sp. E2]
MTSKKKTPDDKSIYEKSVFENQQLFSVITVINDAHDDGIWSVIWTKNSNRIITGSLDDKIKICGDHYTLVTSLTGHLLGITSMSSSADGSDNQLRIWDLKLTIPSIIHIINAGPAEAWKVTFSPDGKYVATSNHSGSINIWHVASGTKKSTFESKGSFGMSINY